MMSIKIGNKIRLLRRKNSVTQDALAAHLGVTPQAVSRWESETCYPDIEYLPGIADFFNVTMDELLCYDGTLKEQKIAEYLEKAGYFADRDMLEEELQLLREAIADIPSSYELQLELASTLSALNAEGEPNRNDLQEAVSICLHILDDCTDDGIRDETKKTLCDIYSHQLDDNQSALEIADRLHSISFCREIVKATVLTGDIAFNQAQINLIEFADNMWWHMYNIACVPDISGNHYTLDQKIEILNRTVKLFELIFGDGNILFYHDRLANSYRQLAMFYLLKNDSKKALDCVEKMADNAIAYDERPEQANYESILINHVEYKKGAGTGEPVGVSKCARLLQGNFSSRIWAPIRGDARFRAAVERMQPYAEKEN